MTTENPNNFFDDLERRLVAATNDRPRRLRRARTRRLATLCTVLVAMLAVGGGIAAALSNSTGNDPGVPAARQHTPAPAPAPSRTALSASSRCGRTFLRGKVDTFDPSAIEVAVLNGTTVPGLARGVAMRLQNDKYKIGTVTNAAAQDQATTQVYYGRAACRTAATLVAQAIDLMRIDQVGRMTKGVAVIAGGRADVAVVVGADQNQRP